MARDKRIVDFEPIPNLPGSGHICLSVYPPGTFVGNCDYVAFVGGCGVGHARNMKEAQSVLLDQAKANLQQRIKDAEKLAKHYTRELARLEINGLPARAKHEDVHK